MTLRRSAFRSVGDGVIASYMHNQVTDGLGKIGVIVALESTGSKEALNELGRKIAQHVAAINPVALDSTSIDPEVIAREKAVLAEKNGAGKPANVVEKIVESGLKSYFKENCLIDQVSIHADHAGKTIGQVVKGRRRRRRTRRAEGLHPLRARRGHREGNLGLRRRSRGRRQGLSPAVETIGQGAPPGAPFLLPVARQRLRSEPGHAQCAIDRTVLGQAGSVADSTGSILTAGGANLAIALAKFAGAALTGSASMFAEGVHSLVDTANQGLLLLGLHRAKRPADARHPFGYGREVYFYSFVVALLLSSSPAGLYSIHEGLAKLQHPEPASGVTIHGVAIPGIAINLGILGFAICVEGYSLAVAWRALPKGDAVAARHDPPEQGPQPVRGAGRGCRCGRGPRAGHARYRPCRLAPYAGLRWRRVDRHRRRARRHGRLPHRGDPWPCSSARRPIRVWWRRSRPWSAPEPKVHAVNEILTQHLGPSDIPGQHQP